MCKPLKDIVAELETHYQGRELLYDIEERRRVIANFDHDVAYMFERLEKFEEDVKFVLDHNLDVNIISRITQNLIQLVQYLCASASDYNYTIDLYLMDERYETNHDLWSHSIEVSRKIDSLIEKLIDGNIFEELTPNYIKILESINFDVDEYKKKSSEMQLIRRDDLDNMNGSELLMCLNYLLGVFKGELDDLKNISIKRSNTYLIEIYELNYLLYATKYWPAQAERFRSHFLRQRLRNRVDISGLERLRHEAAHEFEYNTTAGKIWRDYSEDVTQMAIQMKEQKLNEEQWKFFFQRKFELDEFDRWIEELRNPPESEEDKQKRERLLKTNKVFNLQPAKSKYNVDILLLYLFIRDRFITEKMFVYEWYALYHLFQRYGILLSCTTEDFERQMNDKEWFAHVDKKCSANEINAYGFLSDKSPDIWDVRFKPRGNRASKNSVEKIFIKYSDLEDSIDEIYVKE